MKCRSEASTPDRFFREQGVSPISFEAVWPHRDIVKWAELERRLKGGREDLGGLPSLTSTRGIATPEAMSRSTHSKPGVTARKTSRSLATKQKVSRQTAFLVTDDRDTPSRRVRRARELKVQIVRAANLLVCERVQSVPPRGAGYLESGAK